MFNFVFGPAAFGTLPAAGSVIGAVCEVRQGESVR